MSSFLLVFDRDRGALLELRELGDARDAEHKRIHLELTHRGNAGIEVVVLEAESIQQLRSTHARYFGATGLEDLAKAATASGSK
jgi:hypothetical protein